MSTGALDPAIHHPRRLRILAALAALPDGDTLAISRLQDLIGLPEGSPAQRAGPRAWAPYPPGVTVRDDSETCAC